MNELYTQIIGFLAGGLIIISFIPQLITIIKNKTSHNVSFGMYTISIISQCLWCTYGILKLDLQILITNIGTLIINILIIGFSLYYRYTNDILHSP